MTVNKKNKIINVTLMPYHQRKLNIIKERTGLTASGVIQRFIENHEVFQLLEEMDIEKKEK